MALFEVRLDPESETRLNTSVDQIKSRIAGIGVALGGAIAAYGAHELYRFGEEAARLADAQLILESTGMTMAKLRKETRGFFSDLQLATTYNKAEQLHLGDQFAELARIASAARLKFGLDQELALKDLIIGVSEGRNARLLHLGIFVDFQKEYSKAAAAMGMDKRDLTKPEQVLIGMRAARAIGDQMAAQVEKTGASAQLGYKKLHTTFENLKLSVGGLVNEVMRSLGPALQRGLDWLNEMAQHENVKKFFRDLGWEAARLAEAFFFVVGSAVNLIEIIGKIPGGIHVLTALLTLRAIPALISFGRAIALVFSYSSWSGVASSLRLIQAFIGSLGGLSAVGAVLEFVGPLVAIAFAIDEIAASLSPEKMGFFEEWTGQWDTLREKIFKATDQKTETPLHLAMRGLLDITTRIIEAVEYLTHKLIALFSYGGYLALKFPSALWNGITGNAGKGDWFEGAAAVREGRGMIWGDESTTYTDEQDARNNSEALRKTYQGIFDSNRADYSTSNLLRYNPTQVPMVNTSISIDASGQFLTPSEIRQIAEDVAREHLNNALRQAHVDVTKKGARE